MKKTIILMTAVLTLMTFKTEAMTVVEETATPYVVVQSAPPADKEEVITTSPGPEFTWAKGHWHWDGKWVWLPGNYVRKPHSAALWKSGHWDVRHHGWVWIPGHWD